MTNTPLKYFKTIALKNNSNIFIMTNDLFDTSEYCGNILEINNKIKLFYFVKAAFDMARYHAS